MNVCPITKEHYTATPGDGQPRLLPECGHTISKRSVLELVGASACGTGADEHAAVAGGAVIVTCPLCGAAQPTVVDLDSCPPNWAIIGELIERLSSHDDSEAPGSHPASPFASEAGRGSFEGALRCTETCASNDEPASVPPSLQEPHASAVVSSGRPSEVVSDVPYGTERVAAAEDELAALSLHYASPAVDAQCSVPETDAKRKKRNIKKKRQMKNKKKLAQEGRDGHGAGISIQRLVAERAQAHMSRMDPCLLSMDWAAGLSDEEKLQDRMEAVTGLMTDLLQRVFQTLLYSEHDAAVLARIVLEAALQDEKYLPLMMHALNWRGAVFVLLEHLWPEHMDTGKQIAQDARTRRDGACAQDVIGRLKQWRRRNGQSAKLLSALQSMESMALLQLLHQEIGDMVQHFNVVSAKNFVMELIRNVVKPLKVLGPGLKKADIHLQPLDVHAKHLMAFNEWSDAALIPPFAVVEAACEVLAGFPEDLFGYCQARDAMAAASTHSATPKTLGSSLLLAFFRRDAFDSAQVIVVERFLDAFLGYLQGNLRELDGTNPSGPEEVWKEVCDGPGLDVGLPEQPVWFQLLADICAKERAGTVDAAEADAWLELLKQEAARRLCSASPSLASVLAVVYSRHRHILDVLDHVALTLYE